MGKMLTVTGNPFHRGTFLYVGLSEKQAVKVARKHDCSECRCGGPIITDEEGNQLHDWHATPPFHPASEPFWDKI